MSSAKRNTSLPFDIEVGKSFIYKTKQIGPKTDPCGIPLDVYVFVMQTLDRSMISSKKNLDL